MQPQGSHMCDPQTHGARMTHRGLAMASPYGMSANAAAGPILCR